MNTAIGLVFFLVAVGILCFQFDNVANSMISSMEDFPLSIDELRSYLPGVTLAMVAFASLLTCITATMISLEGRAFNVLKTLPISGLKVIMTKVLAAMLLIVPVTLIGSLVMAVRFQFGIIETVLVLVGVIAMPLVTELIGILINLKYPQFDADNDSVVVKQSASVMVATFLGLGMVLFTISFIFATVFLAGQVAGLLIVDAVYVIVTLFLYFVVAMRGEEKYMKLVA
jgi:ABC-2 type transport system permease protein